MGLFLYDLLSLFKNAPHKIFNKITTQKKLIGINNKGLKGCGMYYDGIVDDAKLGLECIYDGLVSKSAQAKNYKKVYAIEKQQDDIYKVYFVDTITAEKEHVLTKTLQFATGPFTDKVMQDLNIPWSPVILPSKGSHIWLKKDALKLTESMVLQTKDNRIIFVIPSRNSILVGTTEVLQKEDEETLNIKPSPEEIDYLIHCLNEYFPDANITKKDVLSSFAAIRPLVKEGNSSAKTSRKHKVFSPQKNMFILVGGKYTTFRKMAQDLNRRIFKILNIKHDKTLTLKQLRHPSIIQDPFAASITDQHIQNILKQEMVRTKEDLIQRRLSLPTIEHMQQEEKIASLKNHLKTYTKHLPEK